MSGKNTAVFGVYPTHESADAAVDTLRTKGFRNTDISVLFPQNVGSKEFGHEKGTKSAEGAVAGGGTGAVIGGALGWLAGIGMLAIPGASGPSSPPDLSLRPSPAWAPAERSAARPARSSDWVSRSTKRSGTRGG